MTPEEYAQFDGLALADLIRRKALSPREVAETALRAIALSNPAINAVIETFPRRVADSVPFDRPFAGVPFLYKDVGGAGPGDKHECGSRLGQGVVALSESRVTARYREAGLITLGRTASPEMAFNITTETVLNGPTRNPWRLDHSAGGSSGGAAAAVAAGMVPLAEANDGGGSIRIPASACGVFGLKPSRGRMSTAPDASDYLNGLSAAHVVSRSVRDSAAALDAAAGAEPGDPYPVARPERPFRDEIGRPLGPLRIAVATTPWNGGAVDIECRNAVAEAAALCAELGAEVEEAQPELGLEWDDFILANARIWCANIAPWAEALSAQAGRPINEDTLERTTLACYRFGRAMSASDLLAALAACNTVSRSFGAFFTRYDLLLTPTLPAPPPRLGVFDANAPELDGLAWTGKLFKGSPFTPAFNVTGQPAMSVPWGLSAAGLPIGVQFAARLGDDGRLLRLASALESAHPWSHLRPPLHPGVAAASA